MTTLTCAQCGNPIHGEPELAELVAAAPPDRAVSVLCPSCAAAGYAAQHPPLRTFRVSLVIAELVGTTPTSIDEEGNPVGEGEEIWDDVGGFQVKGAAATIRQFAYDNSKTFTDRLEKLILLADADPGPPPPPALPDQKETDQ